MSHRELVAEITAELTSVLQKSSRVRGFIQGIELEETVVALQAAADELSCTFMRLENPERLGHPLLAARQHIAQMQQAEGLCIVAVDNTIAEDVETHWTPQQGSQYAQEIRKFHDAHPNVVFVAISGLESFLIEEDGTRIRCPNGRRVLFSYLIL